MNIISRQKYWTWQLNSLTSQSAFPLPPAASRSDLKGVSIMCSFDCYHSYSQVFDWVHYLGNNETFVMFWDLKDCYDGKRLLILYYNCAWMQDVFLLDQNFLWTRAFLLHHLFGKSAFRMGYFLFAETHVPSSD